jgi:hypothetical protein
MAKMIIGTELNEGFSDKSSETPKLMRRTGEMILPSVFRTSAFSHSQERL